ncbi:MAG: protoporphyrinogen oxidase [Sporocytophaga sp.]|uniref:protoporphyrinogen oxidase n=1 Tax=Sporocytophaga sp. TaxID=2231183 RepID=UPI001B1CE746|nr:protoporphyrinogen oxidase [Sporocytophaga sp.]MBO9700517.1 protoporphyrinogen oxidase [Sporocytophaga sp.]
MYFRKQELTPDIMVGIIGAGISGLTLAYRLQENNIPYLLLEENDLTGGYIKTEITNNYTLDIGPNSILADEEITNFFKAIGIENELIEANPNSKDRYIFKAGKYQVLPDSPPKLLKSNFFSFKTKISILTEFFKKTEKIENETLAHFITRRFNKEVTDYVLNPFVTGIYAGNPEKLLVKLTFPILNDLENKYGSVLKGMIKSGGSSRRKSFNFKKGMATLPKAIAEKLKNLQVNTKVEKVEYQNGQFRVSALSNGQILSYNFSQLVIATPAYAASVIMENISPEVAKALSHVEYPPMALVHTIYTKENANVQLNGFGGLNPKIENKFAAGSIWTSSVFSNRVSNDQILLTSFVGGGQYSEQYKSDDRQIKENIIQDFQKDLKIKGKPVMQKVHRWEKAIPQYDKNLQAAYSEIEKLQIKSLYFCAGWYKGVSLSDCIKNASQLAKNISTLKDIHS